MELSQPSTDNGRLGVGGFGVPNTAQMHVIKAVLVPTMAPAWFAFSTNMPSVKIPKMGPPIAPEIPMAASTNGPIDLAIKATAKHVNPFATARNFPINVAFSVGNSMLNLRHVGFT